MYFTLAVHRVARSLFLDASGVHTSLTLACSRLDGDGMWDVGGSHTFAHQSEQAAKRTPIHKIDLHIRSRAALTDEQLQRWASAPKIGELTFYPRKESTWDLPEFPAKLAAYIFVSGPDLDGIVRALTDQNRGTTAKMFFGDHPSLRYGLRSSGFSAVWNVNANDPASLPVTGIGIEFPMHEGAGVWGTDGLTET